MKNRLDYLQMAKDLTGSNDIQVLIDAADKLEKYHSPKPTGVPFLFSQFCSYVQIRNPIRGSIPLELFDFQHKFATTLCHRSRQLSPTPLIHLTARQLGATTMLCAYALWFGLTSRHQQITMLFPTMAMANDARERMSWMQAHLPNEFAPGGAFAEGFHTGSGSEIVFGSFGSKVSQERATEADLLIMNDTAFLSYSFDNRYEKIIQDVVTDDRLVIVSSVANKPLGLFHKLYTGAEDSDKIMHRWTSQPHRDQQWADSFRITLGEDDFARQMNCEFVP